ncbi:uncharacterized protein LOC124912903 [Impatiens glandulifera]|uniref:uncharacterized protein LOC124912903 n=1 Tax=Impatiens glandulifera TaxID=253017 RepID=UPI001FB18176|nr:uncharacterized protein LOC124912903 [Impatiens glandulifera]
MTGATAKIPISHRKECISVMNLSDTVFEFLDHDRSPELCNGSNFCREIDCFDDIVGGEIDLDKNFWENQHQLLRATLYRTSSLETRIRQETNEGLKELQLAGNFCSCRRPVTGGGCRDCLMRAVCDRLRNAGFNCAISISKWRNSIDIPSGEHKFLDVIDGKNRKGDTMTRVIIELNFRAEFEMNKAGEEYQRLTRKLPEVFVGKVHRLECLIKIVCSAAKKCMKEKKMHMGPWRKQRYMQAKWVGGACERIEPPTASATPAMGWTTRTRLEAGGDRRPMASMLTVDLLETLPKLGCQMVVV